MDSTVTATWTRELSILICDQAKAAAAAAAEFSTNTQQTVNIKGNAPTDGFVLGVY